MSFGFRGPKICSHSTGTDHLPLNLDLDWELLTIFTRNSRNRTRNSTNQIVHFFKFKKLQPKFHFCFWMQDPTGQVCFGVVCALCVFFDTFFALLFPFIV